MSQRKFTRSQGRAKAKSPKTGQEKDHQPSVQVLVWYKEEDWARLKEVFVDGDMLPATYDDWLTRAEAMLEEIRNTGDIGMKVYIDPETFPEWCKEKGLEMNSEARSQMAIEVAQAKSFSL